MPSRPQEALTGDVYRMGRLVQGQLEDGLEAFVQFDRRLASRIIEKDDVVDHFYMAIEEKIFNYLSQGPWPASQWRWLRAALRVVINLEHIGDTAWKIAAQVGKLQQPPPVDIRLEPLAGAAQECLSLSLRAFLEKDLGLAEEVYRTEAWGDHLLEEIICQVTEGLQERPGESPHLFAILFAAENLEKATDYALNISEWVIYWVLGQRMKFINYAELKDLLAGVKAADFQRFWDGVSGATVGGVELTSGEKLVYKAGSSRKLGPEVEKASQWAKLKEGIIPRVLAVVGDRERQAFLRELAQGELLQDYLERVGIEDKLAVTRQLCQVLWEIWEKSLRREPPRVHFIQQVEERLEELYRLHPHLEEKSRTHLPVDGTVCEPLAEVLEWIKDRQDGLASSFSVWIHGDFNTNNILYASGRGFQFIDIARSGWGDYLQDVSVFLVSNTRRPYPPEQAAELAQVNRVVAGLARKFGREYGDAHLQTRLRLGLARSYLTSARLWPEADWANRLYQRGRKLLQQVKEELDR